MSTRNLITGFFVLATTLGLASTPGRGQEPAPAPKEGAAEPRPQKNHYTLQVTVVTTGEGEQEASIKGAAVTVFARDYQQARKTAADGKASFEFDTEEKSVILRVLADRMNPAQPLVELAAGKTECKIVLKKSD